MNFGARRKLYTPVRESLIAVIQRLSKSALRAINSGVAVSYHHESGAIEIGSGVSPHDPPTSGSDYHQRRNVWYAGGYDSSEEIDSPHDVRT